MSCWPGKPAELGVGTCKAGVAACQPDGKLGACAGAILPNVQEVCDNKDDNCNGQTDEGCKPVKAVLRQAGLRQYGVVVPGKNTVELRQQPGLARVKSGNKWTINWNMAMWWKALIGQP